ncbi:hypothetical protein BDQ12DRAFT_665414 [Crucibulum laeve]|uniref:F-box domain-containing protein n=1 Tax=Crucibulum laeve TaxID=68775 RepID=A0A5C3MEL6_9AGAR|nr:hypothetical protein BDQ12DRAFT_665414 [Crucibulum laeve]
MTTLLSLSPELLQEIGHKLGRHQNRELRTVCCWINDALEAMALSTLVININRCRTEACIKQLKAYATKSTDIMVERQLREYLSPALASLTNTQAVIWSTTLVDPNWVYAIVQDFMKTLTDFKHFEINFNDGLSVAPSFNCVHNLTTLTVSALSVRYQHVVQGKTARIIAASPALD